MRNYVLKRLLMLPLLLFAVSVLTFVVLRIVPADAAVARCGLSATDECVEDARHDLGLDKPYFPVSIDRDADPIISFESDSQYWTWLQGAIRGDFGESTTYGSPVRSEIAERIPVTLELLLLSGLLTIVIGVPLGIIAAVKQNTAVDPLVRFVSVFGVSIPGFWLGILMLLFAAIWFQWAPPVTYVPIWEDPVENLKMYAMPAIALAAASVATVMRLTRSSMLDVLRNDYVRTAKAKGLRERQVMSRHAMKNALIPVVTFIGIQLVTLISGAVIIEQVFQLNGIGKLLFSSVFSRDYPMVQGLVIYLAVVVLLTNVAVDVLYGWLDPRIRYA